MSEPSTAAATRGHKRAAARRRMERELQLPPEIREAATVAYLTGLLERAPSLTDAETDVLRALLPPVRLDGSLPGVPRPSRDAGPWDD